MMYLALISTIFILAINTGIANPVLPSSSVSATKLVCPKGYSQPTDSGWKMCYRVSNLFMTHKDAANYCRTRANGTLASVSNAFVNTYINHLAQEQTAVFMLLGIRCPNQNITNCRNDDGTPFTYSNWSPSNLKSPAPGNCVYMANFGPDNSKWYWTLCDMETDFICEAAAEVVAIETPVIATSKEEEVNTVCPDGYTRPANSEGDMCYMVSDDAHSHWDAFAFCRSKSNGMLASVPSADINNYVNELAKKGQAYAMYLGIQCNNTLESCKNNDGTPVNYTNFMSGNLFGTGRCVYMTISDWTNSQWASTQCEPSIRYLCEAKAAPPSTANPLIPTTPNPTGCPNGFTRPINSGFDKCYMVSSDQKNKNEADKVCRSLNGSLASVPNAFVNSFLYQLALVKSNTLLLGIKCENGDPAACTNDDGYPFTYNNFLPNNPNPDAFCVRMSITGKTKQQWESSKCDEEREYACEIMPDGGPIVPPTITTTTEKPINCPQNYTQFQGMCYSYTHVPYSISANQASVLCQQIPGGNLATAATPAVNAFLHTLETARSYTGVVFGLKCDNVEYEGDKRNCKWDDGTPFSYDAFPAGYPKMFGSTGCCEFDLTGGDSWGDCSDCRFKGNDCYICQAPPSQ